MRVHSALQPDQHEDGPRSKNFDVLRRERVSHQHRPGTTNGTTSSDQPF